MNLYRKSLLGMIIISIFVLIVALSSLYVEIQIMSGNVCGCAIPIWLFIPLLASLGLFIGGLTYYFFRPEMICQHEERPINKKALLKLLPADEAKIFGMLMDKGYAMQSEIVKKTGLGKVKVHRLLKKMEGMGIIKKERNKKVFVVRLSDDVARMISGG